MIREINFDPRDNSFHPRRRHSQKLEISETSKKRMKVCHELYLDYKYKLYKFKYWANPNLKLKSKRDMFYFDWNLSRLITSVYFSKDDFLRQVPKLVRLYLDKTHDISEDFCDENINGRVISQKIWQQFFICVENVDVNSRQFEELLKIIQIAQKHPWHFVKLYGAFAEYFATAKQNPSQMEKAEEKFIQTMNSLFHNLPHGKDSNTLLNLYETANQLCNKSLSWNQVNVSDRFSTELGKTMMQRHELYLPFVSAVSYSIRTKEKYLFIKMLEEYITSEKLYIPGGDNDGSKLKVAKQKLSHELATYSSKRRHLQAREMIKAKIAARRRKVQSFSQNQKKAHSSSQDQEQDKKQAFKTNTIYSFRDNKMHIFNAIRSKCGRYIYVASYYPEIKLFCYDLKTNQIEQLGQGIKVAKGPDRRDKITLDKNNLVVSMEKNNLLIVYNFQTKSLRTITTPFTRPAKIALSDEYLLVWTSISNYFLQYELSTLTYKVIYSPKRPFSATDPFSNQNVLFEKIFTDSKRKRIVIIVSGYNLIKPGWWYYYPEIEKFEYVARFPHAFKLYKTMLTEDKILLGSTSYSFILNLKNNSKELLFYASSDLKKEERRVNSFEKAYNVKAKVIIDESPTQTNSANTIVGNYFWTTNPLCRINLKTGQKDFFTSPSQTSSPAIILSPVNNGKALLLVNHEGIFELNIQNMHSI
jgi:hypothetical protein